MEVHRELELHRREETDCSRLQQTGPLLLLCLSRHLVIIHGRRCRERILLITPVLWIGTNVIQIVYMHTRRIVLNEHFRLCRPWYQGQMPVDNGRRHRWAMGGGRAIMKFVDSTMMGHLIPLRDVIIVDQILRRSSKTKETSSVKVWVQFCGPISTATYSNMRDGCGSACPYILWNLITTRVLEAVGDIYRIDEGVRPEFHRQRRSIEHTADHVPQGLMWAFDHPVLGRRTRGRFLQYLSRFSQEFSEIHRFRK